MSTTMLLILAVVAFLAWDGYKEYTNPGSSLLFSHVMGTSS